ncbi:multidrug efflux SMR transporter [Shewanella sp. GutDb-MelDb]|uniref:DMT family transporter n=1 Tax=Shewanella sp. GutDb-MelDb TaxID=2058316 RepID=UPI0021535F8F|nr:multidrug efflux SMR transporter [Shewanella sp. GutDb-MelDb]
MLSTNSVSQSMQRALPAEHFTFKAYIMSWIFLLLGVMAEALSHVALKATDGFSRPLPAVLVILGHLVAFIFLGQAMKGMPVGVVHALWAGLAIVTVTLLSALFYRQHLDLTAWIGMGLVAAGVMMINFSQGHSH